MESPGARIRELRKNKKLTQVQLAKAIELDQSSLSDIETKGAKFSADLLMRLSDELGVPPEFVMRGIATAGRSKEAPQIARLAREIDALPDEWRQLAINLCTDVLGSIQKRRTPTTTSASSGEKSQTTASRR